MNMYNNLEIWKESIQLVKDIYKKSEELPKSEEYIIKKQLKRAVLSVALNIAEGKNRRTSKDFANFLVMSSGSLSEVEALLEICVELGFFAEDKLISEKVTRLSKRINALRSRLQGN